MTMYCHALGRDLPAERTQRYGHAKWVDLRHDLQSAIHYGRRGELSLSEWWRTWRGPKAHTLLSWDDPAPFLLDLGAATKKAFSRLRDSRMGDNNAMPDADPLTGVKP